MVAVDRDNPKDSQIKTRVTGDARDRSKAAVPEGSPPEEAVLIEVSPGHYEIKGEFARGGMGRILLARDRRLGRTVAIKEMRADAGPDASDRFVREALVTARLQHPAIVPVYEAGRWKGGRPFYAMKLVEGRSFEELLEDAEDLSARLALLPHLIAVAEAVAYAHGRRVVHRDLKPANVVVGAFGETVVVDWGLARDLGADPADAGVARVDLRKESDSGATVAGTILGTPHYMSPEQARGLPVDERADVYALGAMLYFLLTGAPPHAGSSGQEVLASAMSGGIDPVDRREPDAPPDLVAIVNKAMAASPEDRYPTALELAADVRRFQTGQLVSAYSYSLRDLVRRFVARHRAEVVVAAALSAILVAAVVIGFVAVRRQARVAEAERDRAQLAAQRAEQIDDFLVGMLGSADPRVLGRDVTVASVLDAASARVEDELGGQPDVKAAVLATLGTTYQGLGMLTEAREHLAASLDAVRLAYGPEDVEVALALNRLAGAFEDEGDYAEAEGLNREALEMLERLGETNGVAAAQIKGSLARVLRWLGQEAEAEALFRETLEIQRRLDGDYRAQIAATLNNLGVLLGQRGDWAAAEPLIREAVDLIRSVRGPEHPEVAASLSTLGTVLEENGDLAGAEAAYRESLAMRERLLGDEHPDTARSLYALAGLQEVQGDAAGALESCRRILALRGEVLPDMHPMVAAALHIEGLSLMDLGRPREAEDAFRESLRLREEALPEDHWLIASSKSALGTSLTAQGHFREAEALLQSAYSQLETTLGPSHERTLETAGRLAELYHAWGRGEEAELWRDRSG
jgi:serine/threonine protein kinase/tetratricopeptide (TPR) repeat protein